MKTIKFEHLTPYVRTALYDTLESSFHIERAIWDYQLIYIADGSLKFIINDIIHYCETGDVLLIRPREKHVLTNLDKKVFYPHFHFDLIKDNYSDKIFVSFMYEDKMSKEQLKWFRKDVLSELGMELPSVIKVHDDYLIKNLFYQIIDEYSHKESFHDAMIQSLLIELLIELARCHEKTIKMHNNKTLIDINKFDKYIYDNIDTALSIESVSASFSLSKWYFIKVFKEYFGTTPKQYISQIKLKRAKQMIRNTNKPIKDIAGALGFESAQSFSRWFRQTDADGKNAMYYRKHK